MHKNALILLAMLVSTVIPQCALGADNPDDRLQQEQQQPLLLDSLVPGVPAEMDDTATSSITVSPSSQPVTLSPVSQKSVYLPVTQPRQIAMFRPAHEHDDLLKTLYGWSATIEVELTSRISSKTAKVGDLVEAKLSQDFRFGNQLIAPKNSVVRGHIDTTQSARTLTRSVLSTERTLKSKGLLAIQFDEIIDTSAKRRWPVTAKPSPRQRYAGEAKGSSQRVIEVDKDGQIVKAEAELTGGLKNAATATKIATMIPLPGTILFNSLAPAIAMGAVGAASPSVAYDKPVDEDTGSAKGAAYGFFSNLPGAFIVKSVVEKGSEINLLPGDPLTLNVCIRESGTQLPQSEQLAVSATVLGRKPTQSRRLYPAGQ
jgi:hypothetical protein